MREGIIVSGLLYVCIVVVEMVESGCDLKTLSHDRCPDNVLERREFTPAEFPCYPHKKDRYEL